MSRDPRTRIALAVATVIATLGGCGRRGELPMPADPVRTPAGKVALDGVPERRPVDAATPAVTPAVPAKKTPAGTTPAAANDDAATPVAATPVAATPRVSPTPSVTASSLASVDRQEIAAMVEAWRDAWQRKDLDRYLAFYAPDFRAEGKDRAAWGTHKAGVFARAGAIDLTFEQVAVTVEAEQARVRFLQVYASGSYRDRGRKELVLVRTGGRWLIREENFARSADR